MTASPKPLISLCMIAKDEAAWLPHCLASVHGLVDEIVLVDTGSMDSTMDIARSFGARVFSRPWEGHFGRHRNQSLAEARGEWILVLDADQELDPATAACLPPSVRAASFGCLFLEIRHLDAGGRAALQWSPLLFRNHAGYRFEGRIHEHLGGGDLRAQKAPVRVIHHGFAQSEDILKAKAVRNLELIEQWIAEEPTSHMARYYAAQTLISWPERASTALALGLEAVSRAWSAGIPPERRVHLYQPVFMALTSLGNFEELAAQCRTCLSLAPHYPDPLFSLCVALDGLEDWEGVCRAARRFCLLQESWRTEPMTYPYAHNHTLENWGPVLRRWVRAASQLGREDEATEARQLLEREEPRDAGHKRQQKDA